MFKKKFVFYDIIMQPFDRLYASYNHVLVKQYFLNLNDDKKYCEIQNISA